MLIIVSRFQLFSILLALFLMLPEICLSESMLSDGKVLKYYQGNIVSASDQSSYPGLTTSDSPEFVTIKTSGTSVFEVVQGTTLQSRFTHDAYSTGLNIETIADLPIRFHTTGFPRWRIQYGNGKLLGEQLENFIGVNTNEYADSGSLIFSASPDGSTARGGSIAIFGRDYIGTNPSYAGDVHIFSGKGGQIWLGYHDDNLGAQDAIGVRSSGEVGIMNSLMIGGKADLNGPPVPTSKLQIIDLPGYPNNAAAVAAGLTSGALYRVTGTGLGYTPIASVD